MATFEFLQRPTAQASPARPFRSKPGAAGSAPPQTGAGSPLPPLLRSRMQSAFGGRVDLGGVRIREDESPRALGAIAYSAGQEIVFRPGRYAPQTEAGQRLLTHELAHVVQRGMGVVEPRVSRPDEPAEREAQGAVAALASGAVPSFGAGPVPSLATFPQADEDELHRPIIEGFRRQHGLEGTDDPSAAEIKYEILPEKVAQDRAQQIIDAAADTKVPIDTRAVALVRAIIDTYYPDDRGLVSDVVYTASDPGLTTDAVDSPTARGLIHVGRYFVEHATREGFPRRVLQVMHELEHVRQHRRGMGGPAKKDEREFLAFHLEATTREARGTGKMDPGTRILLIDAALGSYNCFTDAMKERYRAQQAELLALRDREKAANGGRGGRPPTECHHH